MTSLFNILHAYFRFLNAILFSSLLCSSLLSPLIPIIFDLELYKSILVTLRQYSLYCENTEATFICKISIAKPHCISAQSKPRETARVLPLVVVVVVVVYQITSRCGKFSFKMDWLSSKYSHYLNMIDDILPREYYK